MGSKSSCSLFRKSSVFVDGSVVVESDDTTDDRVEGEMNSISWRNETFESLRGSFSGAIELIGSSCAAGSSKLGDKVGWSGKGKNYKQKINEYFHLLPPC